MLDDIERQIFASNPVAWFELYGRIEDKEVGSDPDKPPKANALQQQLGEAIEWCLKNHRPIRIIIYKPRQQGCSTITVEVLYVLGRVVKMKVLIIGGQASQSDNLWKILRYYGDKDTFDWGNTWSLNEERAKCSNGTEWERETAGDPNAGRSGNYHAIIVTELARWPTDGTKSAATVLNSVLNCCGDGEGTVQIIESTAQGPKGPFPENWSKAVTLDQMKAGKFGNGFIKLFCPWYLFDRCRTALESGETPAMLAQRIQKAGDEKAMRVWSQLKLAPEQIKWFHEVLHKPECGGDGNMRDREYPTFEEDGFKASSPSRFDLRALERYDIYAASRADDFQFGTMTLQPGLGYRESVFLPCAKEQADVCILEKPIPGEYYIIATDNGRGKSLTTGDDTDPNAVVVWRRGKIGSRGQWVSGEIVAALCPENREDQPFLAETIARLHGYYGCCTVVPEENRGELLIEKLREKGVTLWTRERKSSEVELYKETNLIGWQTTPETKHYLIENLAAMVVKGENMGGCVIGFPWIISEMRTFVRHKDGTLGALKLAGCHDDFVIATGIAAACEASATLYLPARGQTWRPEGLPREDEGRMVGVW